MHRLHMFCSTHEDRDAIKVPDRIPETMTLDEYNRLKRLNSSLGSAYQFLNTDITLGNVDYSNGLKQQDELLTNINNVRKVLRHFEKQMVDKHGVNSGLDDKKQLHVYELTSDDLAGGRSGQRMTLK